MPHPFPSTIAVALAVVAVGLSGVSDGKAGAILGFRSGQDVALRGDSRARSHPSAAAEAADPPDPEPTSVTYTQYLNVPNLKLPGYLRVQLTDTEFTARLFLGGRLVTQIKGTLGEEKEFSTNFNDAKGAEVAYKLTLKLEQPSGQSELSGTLDLADPNADPPVTNTVALRLRPRALDSSHAGNYTLALPPDFDGAPHPTRNQQYKVSSLSRLGKRPAAISGIGYGLLRVSRSGTLHAVAVLADGQRVSFGGYFDSVGNVPVFTQLYKSTKRVATDEGDIHGYLGGIFRFRDRPRKTDAVAILRWMRPSAFHGGNPIQGFSVVQPALVSRYVKVDNGLSILDGVHDERLETEITLVDGGLRSSIDTTGTVEADKVKGNRPDFYANFATDYGLFRGHFDHPGPHAPVNMEGVVLQKQGRAFGQFFDRFGRSGAVFIRQKPESTSSSSNQ